MPYSSRAPEGPGPLKVRQPTDRHGGNARTDEERTMAEEPFRESTPKVYARPPVDGTDKEIEEWASYFVDAILGPLPDPANGEP